MTLAVVDVHVAEIVTLVLAGVHVTFEPCLTVSLHVTSQDSRSLPPRTRRSSGQLESHGLVIVNIYYIIYTYGIYIYIYYIYDVYFKQKVHMYI